MGVIQTVTGNPSGRRRGADSLATGCTTVFLILFFGAFLALGGFATYFMVREFAKEYRVQTWPQVPATITDSRTILQRSRKGSTSRPEFTFTYDYNGRAFTATGYAATRTSSSGSWARDLIAELPVGSTTTAWVNPDNPSEAYLRAGFSWWHLMVALPLLFVLVGAGGIYGTIRKAMGRPATAPKDTAGPDALAIPKCHGMGSGRLLRWRLGTEVPHHHMALGLFLVGAFWNAIVMPGLYFSWRDREMAGVAFLSLFVLVGLGIWGAAVHRLLRVTMLGSTRMELSAEPVQPGQTVRWAFQQEGNFTVNQAVVRLVCLEWVQYRAGTRTLTKEEKVFEQDVLRVQGGESRAGAPLFLSGEVRIPEDAMHSFEAPNNKVKWRFEVHVDIPGRPDVKDEFPFRVLPLPVHGLVHRKGA